jgi:hypothetical protein
VFSILFPVRTGLACERNTPYLSAFSSGRNIIFMENWPMLLKGETHVSPGSIPSELEAGVSHTMLPIEHIKRMLTICGPFQVEEIFS